MGVDSFMVRNLTTRKDDIQSRNKSKIFKDPVRVQGRDLLFNVLMNDLNRFGQLDSYDKIFVIGIVRKKIVENEVSK